MPWHFPHEHDWIQCVKLAFNVKFVLNSFNKWNDRLTAIRMTREHKVTRGCMSKCHSAHNAIGVCMHIAFVRKTKIQNGFLALRAKVIVDRSFSTHSRLCPFEMLPKKIHSAPNILYTWFESVVCFRNSARASVYLAKGIRTSIVDSAIDKDLWRFPWKWRKKNRHQVQISCRGHEHYSRQRDENQLLHSHRAPVTLTNKPFNHSNCIWRRKQNTTHSIVCPAWASHRMASYLARR